MNTFKHNTDFYYAHPSTPMFGDSGMIQLWILVILNDYWRHIYRDSNLQRFPQHGWVIANTGSSDTPVYVFGFMWTISIDLKML